MDAQENCNATFPRDRVGKVFIAFVDGTRDASREHCAIPCVPAVPDLWLLKEFLGADPPSFLGGMT
jgi:hypothetical protein